MGGGAEVGSKEWDGSTSPLQGEGPRRGMPACSAPDVRECEGKAALQGRRGSGKGGARAGLPRNRLLACCSARGAQARTPAGKGTRRLPFRGCKGGEWALRSRQPQLHLAPGRSRRCSPGSRRPSSAADRLRRGQLPGSPAEPRLEARGARVRFVSPAVLRCERLPLVSLHLKEKIRKKIIWQII